ncbi:MAG: diaminopimelate decarboxylase [Candidatus Lokiarchaeota archaeon]|nr:diaminopimelate decarboxylase [Candidatus Lokiarchaeota archaeon]
MDYFEWLSYKDLEYRDGILYFANMNTIEIAEKYGTPIYIINEKMIRKRYRELKDMLNSVYKKNRIHFAVKSNTNLAVLKILSSEGSFFDCSSTGEIYTCLKSGIPSDRIIYTGNMFTDNDFEFAVKQDILVNLDSYSQLERLTKIYDKIEKKKNLISFRFNPEFGAGHHPYTITAGKEIKFGILEHQVIKAYSKAKELGFTKFGIHQHIGSGIIKANDYEMPAQKFLNIIEKIAEELGIQFEFVDFGGGLGIPYYPETDPLDLNRYSDIVFKRFKESVENGEIGEPYLFIEPGRYISAESSILLTQVNTIKDNGFKLFAGIDAGFNTLLRPTLYGSYHHIIVCEKRGKQEDLKYDVVGPICESGDVLGKERVLPKLSEGDYLAILDVGAYGFTMSSSYNSRPRAAELLINDGNIYKIRNEETFDDLVKAQIIPKHLKEKKSYRG